MEKLVYLYKRYYYMKVFISSENEKKANTGFEAHFEDLIPY